MLQIACGKISTMLKEKAKSRRSQRRHRSTQAKSQEATWSHQHQKKIPKQKKMTYPLKRIDENMRGDEMKREEQRRAEKRKKKRKRKRKRKKDRDREIEIEMPCHQVIG